MIWEQGGSGEGQDNFWQIATSPDPWGGQTVSIVPHFLQPLSLYLWASPLKRVPETGMPGATCFDIGKSQQIFKDAGFLQIGIKAFPVPWQQFAF